MDYRTGRMPGNRTEADMTAREINQLIRDAATRGRNVYADRLMSNIGLTMEPSIRVVRAQTKNGQIKVRTPSGDWYRVYYATTFDAR